MSHSGWLSKVFKPNELKVAAEDIANQIKYDNVNGAHIEAIAVTVLSGLTFGCAVSLLTGIPLIALRKTDYSHSSFTVEYDSSLKRCGYCIVDDLIASGATIERIIETLKAENANFRLEKIYLYSQISIIDFFRTKNLENIPIYALPF